MVTSVRKDRAEVKLMGYLALGELDKRNAEGADSDAGWWTERLVRT